MLLYDVLSEAGYDVQLAENGKHAFQLLNQTSCDMVISEIIFMPEMDGISLYHKIAQDLPGLKDRARQFGGQFIYRYGRGKETFPLTAIHQPQSRKT